MQAIQSDIIKIDRLKKRSDFLWVQSHGRKWIAKGIIVEIADNSSKGDNLGIRYGLTVSKRVSKLAVKRNLIKRRLRAIAQEIMPAYATLNMDIVIVGRFGALERDFDVLKKDLVWCLNKLEVKS